MYRRSARVIALSPGIRDGVAAAGVAPGADRAGAERLRPRAVLPRRSTATPSARRLGLGDGFVCSYFGTLGEANDLSQVVRAAPLLDGVTFVLLGDGKRRAGLRARGARARGGQRRVPATRRPTRRTVARLAAASDACLTIFKDVPVLATNSPNKLFDTFAAGRPAIVNQPGWMRELVERNEAGLFVRPGDPGGPGREGGLAARPPGRGRALRPQRARCWRSASSIATSWPARALAVLEEAAA